MGFKIHEKMKTNKTMAMGIQEDSSAAALKNSKSAEQNETRKVTAQKVEYHMELEELRSTEGEVREMINNNQAKRNE